MSGVPFAVEYAKSGRSKCYGCNKNIVIKSLRVATLDYEDHDGKVYRWYHPVCFFRENHPVSITEFEGSDNIRWDDQQLIKSEIELKNSPAKSHNGSKRFRSLSPEFTIECATSDNLRCAGCDTFISKSSIVIAKLNTSNGMDEKDEDFLDDYHLDCFCKIRESLNFYSSAETIKNFGKLTENDKKNLIEKLPEIENPEGPSFKKKSKLSSPDAEEEKIMEEQTEKLFKLRDELEVLDTEDLCCLLQYNDQFEPKGKPAILDELCDRMIFGSLKKCEKCSGDLCFVSGVGYKCQGGSEYRCPQITNNPERFEFKIPEELQEREPFNIYKATISRRAFRKKIERIVEEKQIEIPLKNMKFVIAGKTMKNEEDLRNDIVLLGGVIVSEVDETLSAVIASKETLEENSEIIKEAEQYKIKVVTEDFVEEAKNNGVLPFTLVYKKNIAPWIDDINKQHAEFMEKYMSGKIKRRIKAGSWMYEESGLCDVAHVFENEDGKYSVRLIKIDVIDNKNSFYYLQVLQHDDKEEFHLFRYWGRIGTDHVNSKCEPMNKQACLKKFEKLFKEKTGNEWFTRKFFEKVLGMYDLIPDDSDIDELDSGIPSKLEKPVQDLVKLLFNENVMKNTMKEYELDLDRFPFGKLPKQQLLKARGILEELHNLLENDNPNRSDLVDRTNKFYTLVPHSFGTNEPPIIDNYELIKAKQEMLDSLIEMELTYDILEDESDETENKIDLYYKRLNTDIHVLDKDSEDFKIIEEWTKNTHCDVHKKWELTIQDVFVIKRHGEEERYEPFKTFKNRKLLWHGSRITNFVGILTKGLRIAPPEAAKSGSMLGKAIYFADMASKSAQYCCVRKSNPTGLLLLAEVALGDMYEKYHNKEMKKLPKNKDSIFAVGKTIPNPEKIYRTPDGVEVPYGRGVHHERTDEVSLLHSEYTVYDDAQVKLKYLVRMYFHFLY